MGLVPGLKPDLRKKYALSPTNSCWDYGKTVGFPRESPQATSLAHMTEPQQRETKGEKEEQAVTDF